MMAEMNRSALAVRPGLTGDLAKNQISTRNHHESRTAFPRLEARLRKGQDDNLSDYRFAHAASGGFIAHLAFGIEGRMTGSMASCPMPNA
jgi:hypothetical protein